MITFHTLDVYTGSSGLNKWLDTLRPSREKQCLVGF